MLTEQGIPALLLYIILLVTIFLTAQRVYNISSEENRKYIIAITLCIVSFLFNNTLSDFVEANKVGSLFFISLALLINFSSREISLKDKNR